MENLIQKIKEIAANNELGFTITLPACEFVKSGYVVAMLETQNSFGDEGLAAVIAKSTATTGVMGGWSEGGLFYWDAVYLLTERAAAIELGRQNEQIAIYNIENNELIYI
jgi:hypothetical protein